MADEISVSEWLKELERITNCRNDEGMTTEELEQATGMSKLYVQRLLKMAHAMGKLVRGVRVADNHYSGKRVKYHVYRIMEG